MNQLFKNASLDQLVQTVANFFDAHTAALFISRSEASILDLVAIESICPHIVSNCRIRVGRGLIGWVARENKCLNVTEFGRDTRTLGLYSKDVGIKAFMASPLPEGRGVLMVDSRNRYAFPEKRQKILNDCAILAYELYLSHKMKKELYFFRTWRKWFLTPHSDLTAALEALKSVFGLKWGLVINREQEGCPMRLVALSRPKDAGLIKQGMVIKGSQGLSGWVLDHKRHLVLAKRHPGPKTFILYPEEPIELGSLTIGIYQPDGKGANAWIFTGDRDYDEIPQGALELVASALQKIEVGV